MKKEKTGGKNWAWNREKSEWEVWEKRKRGERRKGKEKKWSEAEIDRRRMETEGKGQMEGIP
jgi:hypothetical protein